MCGIIGYIGNKNAMPIIIEGLKKLEYRGYDSAGIAVVNENTLYIEKCKGKISDLDRLLMKRDISGTVGLGHTRWATHGKPSKVNAHPHTDSLKKIIVVHNGIIENFNDLKGDLEKEGFKFESETDTEVAAHLISKFYDGNLKEAVKKALRKIKGSYALGVLSLEEPDKIVVARRDSPLAIGLGEDENFIASDVSAVLSHTKKVIYLEDNQIAVVNKDDVKIFDVVGKEVHKKIDTISYDIDEVQKGGFEHFMLKEIHEQPNVLLKIISRYVTSSGNIKFEGLNIKNETL